jgi:hypothetical protein
VDGLPPLTEAQLDLIALVFRGIRDPPAGTTRA